jgi:hypothetical protein
MMKLPSHIGFAALLLLATGTVAHAQTVAPPPPGATPQARHFMELASTPERARAFLSGETRMTYDAGHGTQVEYNAPDGHSYLWYPGSPRLTPGFWKTTQVLAPDGVHIGVRVCYMYPANGIEPTDGSRGGDWSCNPAWYSLMRTTDKVEGDPFGLARRGGAAPFILSPAPTSLAQLLGQRQATPEPSGRAKPVAGVREEAPSGLSTVGFKELGDTKRFAVLSALIRKTRGEACKPTNAVPGGYDPNGASAWRVRCEGSVIDFDYLVMLPERVGGKARVLACFGPDHRQIGCSTAGLSGL